jgi:hypothetical protein
MLMAVIFPFITPAPGPYWLIVGWSGDGKALPVVYPCRSMVDIIMVYEPDPIEWEPDLRTRRRPSQ